MDLLIWGVVFAVSLAVLVKSADWFVDAASNIGAMLGVPEFLMGITLVALGTSLPELATSLVAVSQGETEFIIGNAVGSNATNILLVLGASAVFISNYRISRSVSGIDLALLLVSAVLIAVFAWTGRQVVLSEGLILMIIYAVYVGHLIRAHRGQGEEATQARRVSPFIWLVLTAAGIYFGAGYTLKATIHLSQLFGFSDTSTLALTAVALGTSLPELAVSISAARKGSLDMAVGNIIGSNIFNSLVVIGLPALITPILAPSSVLKTGLGYMLVATFLCCLTLIRRRIGRVMGFLFLVLYAALLADLFGLY